MSKASEIRCSPILMGLIILNPTVSENDPVFLIRIKSATRFGGRSNKGTLGGCEGGIVVVVGKDICKADYPSKLSRMIRIKNATFCVKNRSKSARCSE